MGVGLNYFLRSDRGATAVEFALVAVPLMFLLIGIIEMSLMFAGMSILHGATNEGARLVRTGQVQTTTGDPEDLFQSAVCAHADTLLRCDQLQYEVVQIPSFSSVGSFEPQVDADGDFVPRSFDAGGVNDTVLIRTYYRYPLLTPFIGQLLADGPNNTRIMMSTIVLQTEPYALEEEE
ncbi:MAG: TadE/TadG family type IV pilus assembly protein [Pseudomonadota bacterium]